MHEAVFNSRQPIQTYSLSLYAKMGLFLYNYCINIYNICQPLVMWYLNNVVLCSHYMSRNTLVHICNTHNDACTLHPILHTQWIASGRQLSAGRRLIAITIILPFLVYHRNVQLGDAVSATVGSRVIAQTVESSATRGAWMHTTWGHFLIEQL